jgi:hypothetical protein
MVNSAHLSRILSLALFALLTGCAWYTVVPTFSKTANYTPRTHTKDEILLLMNGTVPLKPNYHVGQVQVTRSDLQSNDDVFNAMRELAVTHGFDGISEISCGPDYYTAFMCLGQAFVFDS